MSTVNPSEHSVDRHPSHDADDPECAADEWTGEASSSDPARRGGGPLLAWWNSHFGEDNRA